MRRRCQEFHRARSDGPDAEHCGPSETGCWKRPCKRKWRQAGRKCPKFLRLVVQICDWTGVAIRMAMAVIRPLRADPFWLAIRVASGQLHDRFFAELSASQLAHDATFVHHENTVSQSDNFFHLT